MKIKTVFTALVLTATSVVALSSFDAKPAGDPPGKIEWHAENNQYKADGSFTDWKFTKVEMNKGDLTSLKASLEINIASMSEKSAKLVGHLQSADFFNVAKFATATVNISDVKAGKDGKYTAKTELTAMGITKEVPLEFEVVSKSPLQIKGTTTVDRDAFKIGMGFDHITKDVMVKFEAAVPAKL